MTLTSGVEDEISVKTQYNNCGEGWAICGKLRGTSRSRPVGFLLVSVLFTCGVFFDFVPAFSGKPPGGCYVAYQWLP
jgi:hypothetical protein